MKISHVVALYSKKLFSVYTHHTATQVAWWLLEKATNKDRVALLAQETIDKQTHEKIEAWLADITDNHMPVQYILGSVPFLELDIMVEAPLLIPRPETEAWCQELITDINKTAVQEFELLDLCSGTGCIALSIAHAFPHASITASDINAQACALIARNREKNSIKNCSIQQSNLFEELPAEKKYSIITANPPYVTQAEWHNLAPRVKNWESPQALVADTHGLAIIEKIINQAPDYLEKPLDGVAQLWLEIGESQATRVIALFKKAQYKNVAIHKDPYGKNRVITGSL